MPPAAHLERELKLDPGREPIDLATLGEPLERRTFVSTYYDTETRSLARSGLTLRRRVENGASLWQLKLPADEGRIEIELRAGPRPPAELVSVLAAHLRRERLERVATLRTRRSGVRVTRRGRSARSSSSTGTRATCGASRSNCEAPERSSPPGCPSSRA